jgi:hypothetical protein
LVGAGSISGEPEPGPVGFMLWKSERLAKGSLELR